MKNIKSIAIFDCKKKLFYISNPTKNKKTRYQYKVAKKLFYENFLFHYLNLFLVFFY